jgi:hypothetical protein
MLLIIQPKTNAERQREFRARNPNYYARIQATKRAAAKRMGARCRLAQQAAHRAALAGEAQQEVVAPAAEAPLGC